jgi:hypothetical protein
MSEEQAKHGKSFDTFDKMMRQKPRPPRPGEENAYTKKRAESGERQALSPQKRGLLDIIEGVYYGEIEKIIVKRGEPVFVKVATRDIKLD